jgi:hypothetical protein
MNADPKDLALGVADGKALDASASVSTSRAVLCASRTYQKVSFEMYA